MVDRLVVGIVGKIGSGKSTVAAILANDFGFELIDVDKYGHQALELKKEDIVHYFSSEVLDSHSKIDRSKLGNLVFADLNKLTLLNSLVHPLMKENISKKISEYPHGRFLIDAALLFEMGLDDLCDFIISIDAPESEIIDRVSNKRGWPRLKVEQVLKAQQYLDFLKDKSHFIIFNNGNMDKLKKQVEFFILEIA